MCEKDDHLLRSRRTVCDIVPVGDLPERDTRKWAGVDSVWDQKKLEARRMLENAARREAAVPSVQCIILALAQDALLAATNLFYLPALEVAKLLEVIRQ